MSCEPVKMPDGTMLLVDVKEGETLNEDDRKVLAEYVEFCRERRRKKAAKKAKKGDS